MCPNVAGVEASSDARCLRDVGRGAKLTIAGKAEPADNDWRREIERKSRPRADEYGISSNELAVGLHRMGTGNG